MGVLRDVAGAPLPGKTVARFDLQRQIFDRAYLLEDAHAQESSTCQRIVQDLAAGDVVIADRHYCIVWFLQELVAAKANFVIRQHGRLKGVVSQKRKRIGQISSGVVYEQTMRLRGDPDSLQVRRITVVLDRPTRDGDIEIHLLTNLPTKVDALSIANAYRHRWEEESAFHVLQMTLTCELASVGHPRAALMLFCLSMLAFNLRQVIFAGLYAVHAEEDVDEVSHFHISKEVSNKTEGMLIALPAQFWSKVTPSTITAIASLLTRTASGIPLAQYRKARRGPKKKKPHRSRNVRSSHVSTARRLNLPSTIHP